MWTLLCVNYCNQISCLLQSTPKSRQSISSGRFRGQQMVFVKGRCQHIGLLKIKQLYSSSNNVTTMRPLLCHSLLLFTENNLVVCLVSVKKYSVSVERDSTCHVRRPLAVMRSFSRTRTRPNWYKESPFELDNANPLILLTIDGALW